VTRVKRKIPADTAWPPAGVRDLKPDIPVNSRADRVGFPTLREALERDGLKQAPPATQISPATLAQQLVPDTRTQQIVLDLRRRTRSRTIEYLCRAYLQFGQAAMGAKDLETLRGDQRHPAPKETDPLKREQLSP
jgi:hypothetical protein